MTTDPKTFWLGKLTNLRTAVTDSRGIAPHKPLMILSVLDLIEAGILGDPWVQFNAALTTQFRNYWDIVWERQNNKPDIKTPFNALGSVYDAVWQCYDLNGNPSSSKQASVSAEINAELWQCMQCPNFRQELRSRLTAHYFRPAEQVALYERLGLEIPDSEAIRNYQQNAEAFKQSQTKGRDSRFKSSVCTGYRYICALTGYSLQTANGYLVEAAHIHQHARSGNNHPNNGLALTPDAHWMFDNGLWTAVPKGDHFVILIKSSAFTELSLTCNRSLMDFHNKPLCFHPTTQLHPAAENLRWHYKHHGFAG